MLLKIFLAASALAATCSAQTIETSSASSVAASTTVSQIMPPVATQAFNPALVNASDAFNWCLGQRNTCPQMCGGSASQNWCNSDTFTYSCVCANGTVPDSTAFAGTLPFFICQETYIQCMAANPTNAQAQAVCAENEQCGTRNATAEALAATSAAQSTTASETAASSTASETESATATSESASSTPTGGAATQQIATGAFAALLLAGIKLLL
ncbi:hypothetical protein PV10_02476 [Exophiala mesophila]|uniref:DUF7707 domain-containing protein n=1 Tax=Exophiala mesophila TaxID=212818 RepID=A0A0D2A6U4_EXOME|nr:uncharacterized protein PV10_02476 [Exophiala mesophila]KIV94743.1 hypothetical protein PV10_02476 [Exophiala mesophila]